MYEQIENLPLSLWDNSDRTLRLRFLEVKGLTMIKVIESSKRSIERSYLLLPTLDPGIFSFETPNGKFHIGICSEGKELLLSPLGVFLQPYGTPQIHAVDMNINSEQVTTVSGNTETSINENKSE